MSPKKSPPEVEPEASAVPIKPGGKGRPTPKRSESENKRVAVKAPQTRKEALAITRDKRRQESRTLREGMRSGDVSKLPARERAPERVLARDIVDTRRNLAVLMLPVLIPLYVVQAALKNSTSPIIAVLSTFMLVGLLAVIFDSARLSKLVKRTIATRYPEAKVRGMGFYAMQRAAMPRRLRQPAPRLKLGDTISK